MEKFVRVIIVVGLICLFYKSDIAYSLYDKYCRETIVEEIVEEPQILTKDEQLNISTQFEFKFVRTSKAFNIADDMIFTTNEFSGFAAHYLDIISSNFTPQQLRGLKEILISDAQAFGENEAGECQSINKDSYILIAAHSSENDKVLFHEICHAIQNYNMDIFNELRSEWESCDDFITTYAKTNIDEDFAETGAYYLDADANLRNKLLESKNIKFKLFKIFFDKIKNRSV